MPKISVIVPNYNHAKFLEKRINTILYQTYQDFELIILDDFSTDNSKEIIELYRNHPKISQIIYNTENSGSPFRQWKKGIELAKGKYIWLAESDDYADLNFLEILIKPFIEFPDMIISYSQSMLINENDNNIRICDWADDLNQLKWKKDYVETSNTELNKFLRYRNTISNASAVLFKKPKLDIFDYEILGMRLLGDWLFWQRLLGQNGKVSFFHKPLNYWREHPESTREFTSKEKEILRFKEFNIYFKRNFFNIFDNKFDWIVITWLERRKVFKGTLYQYVPPNFPMGLIVRTYWLIFLRYIDKLF